MVAPCCTGWSASCTEERNEEEKAEGFVIHSNLEETLRILSNSGLLEDGGLMALFLPGCSGEVDNPPFGGKDLNR